MTLLELCEPLFLKICELNRMARLGQSQDYQEVRVEVMDCLREIHAGIEADSKLAQVAGPLIEVRRKQTLDEAEDNRQIWQIELVLTFFVDSMIASSRLKFAAQWDEKRVAVEQFNELSGDDDFFELLDKTKADSSDQASERLAVFYVCMAIGFEGGLADQFDELRRRMKEILPRIKHYVDVEKNAELCPDAYVVDERRLLLPVRDRAIFMVVLAIFLGLATMVAYVGMYVNSTKELATAVDKILGKEKEKRP